MRKAGMIVSAVIVFLLIPLALWAREVPPIVNSDWLEKELTASNPKLVILDTRKVEDYKAGHIPKAVNVFFGSWAIKKGDLQAELPEIDDLSDLISGSGIGPSSLVVIVESEGGPRFHFATRVAWTLAYLGLDNVAILDGGYAAWTKAGKTVSTEPHRPAAAAYKVNIRKEYLATGEYLLSQSGKAQLVDVRTYDAYFGRTKMPFVSQWGHIPKACSFPKEWLYEADGMIAPKEKIESTLKAAGFSSEKETILYCDTGMGCTAVWWILHEYLGWSKVKSNDDGTERISKDPNVRFSRYTCSCYAALGEQK